MLNNKNIFDLYDNKKYRPQAEKEIKDLIDSFINDLEKLQTKWRVVGADDTASREAIAMYIAKEKLCLVKIE